MTYLYLFIVAGVLGYALSAANAFVGSKTLSWVGWGLGLLSFSSLSLHLVLEFIDVRTTFATLFHVFAQLIGNNLK